jgi:N-methylhydantoinase B
VILTNDPYSCGARSATLNDWLVMMPIFKEGRLIAGPRCSGT